MHTLVQQAVPGKIGLHLIERNGERAHPPVRVAFILLITTIWSW
jgi:hypothetical protein